MSIEEARIRASQLNSLNSLERDKIRKAAVRVLRLEATANAYLPEGFVDEFSKALLGRRSSSDQHKKRLISHWKRVEDLVKALELQPQEYADNSERIYDWFAENQISLEYAQKLIQLLNRWGAFVSKKSGVPYWKVEAPRARDRTMIADANRESESYRGESEPLTPELLSEKQRELTVSGNYEWLFVSIWFGLRPYEVDCLMKPDPKTWRLVNEPTLAVDVLEIYQSKLAAIDIDKRWKRIPIVFPEQIAAIEYVRAGLLKTPLYKTMQRVFGAVHVTKYGGRKGFIDLMLARGQRLEDISYWMGHTKISTTWEKYRNKRRVSFTKTA